jgi:hypothetical protein
MKSFSPRRSRRFPARFLRLACALASFTPIAAKETNHLQLESTPPPAPTFQSVGAKPADDPHAPVLRMEEERPLAFRHDAGLALIVDVVCLLDQAMSNRECPPENPGNAAWEADERLPSRFEEHSAELLAHLRAITARTPMAQHEFLTADGKVQRAVFGTGAATVVAVINTGETEFRHHSSLGDDVVLPLFGFVVEGPGFALFHASRWSGVDYAHPPLFSLRSLDGRPLANSRRIHVFRAYGDARLNFAGMIESIPSEAVLTPGIAGMPHRDALAGN